ncbi:MAG: hypothetical protein E7Z74_02305 [Methanobrevibacter millerae]|uniref:Adhesin-like protein n=1 Tax=Methanobrevibacter millerae TaxID=230361 RepID=A0A8T3VFR7_9EURY|nr:hypothetical protein [Methanobrevibacter millerae]
MRRKFLIVICLILFVVSISAVSAADDLNQTADDDTLSVSQESELGVDDGTFATLQNKIKQAPAGSTINLENDYRYNSDVDSLYGIGIDKALTINGNGHTLDGLKTSRIFEINTEAFVTFNNIRFVNGQSHSHGGAICQGSILTYGNLIIDNCYFIDNHANQFGGAIDAYYARMSNSYFINNHAEDGAGAVVCSNGADIIDCEFRDNYVVDMFAGAIYMPYDDDSPATVSIKQSKFINNRAGDDGGAVYTDCPLTISDCYFQDNFAGLDGGALYVDNNFNILSSVFFNNHAERDGGAISTLEDCCSEIHNSNFVNNTAHEGSAIYYDENDEENSKIYNGNFINNFAEYGGWYHGKYNGAIYGECEIYGSNFINNYVKIYDPSNIGFNLFLVFQNGTASPNSKIELCQFQDEDENVAIFDSGMNVNAKLTNRDTGKVHYITLYYDSKSFGYYYECKLEEGIYDVTGSADVEYLEVKDSVLIVDGDTNFTLSVQNLAKYVGGPEKLTATVVNGKGRLIPGIDVNFTINGKDYTRTTDSNGVASININLGAGNYTIKCSCAESSCEALVQVISTLYGDDLTKYHKNASQYYITCLDTKGDKIASGNIEFNINGVFYTRSITDGVARMNINLNPGEYIITARNLVNGELHSNKIKVLTTIVENYDLTKYYKNDSQYRVRLLDGQGNPVGAGVSVEFNINGVFYTRTSDAQGYVKMNINLNPGTYIITANYNGLMASNKITVLPILKGEDLVMSYRDGSKFEVTLLDGQGKLYANQTIIFNINGVFYNRTTDANGIARLNINLMAGEYIITSMYENGATISNKITIRS